MKKRLLTKIERKKFFEALPDGVPGYVCRKCWKAVAIPAGSGEPLCQCKEPRCVPRNIVGASLPENWWRKAA